MAACASADAPTAARKLWARDESAKLKFRADAGATTGCSRACGASKYTAAGADGNASAPRPQGAVRHAGAELPLLAEAAAAVSSEPSSMAAVEGASKVENAAKS